MSQFEITPADVGTFRDDHEKVRGLTRPAATPLVGGPQTEQPAPPIMAWAVPAGGGADTQNAWGWALGMCQANGAATGGGVGNGSGTCGVARDVPGTALVVYGTDITGLIRLVLVRTYVNFWATLGATGSDGAGGVVYAWNAMTGQGFDGASGSASLGGLGAANVNTGSAMLSAGAVVRIHQRVLPGGTKLHEFAGDVGGAKMFTITASSPLSGTQWVYTGNDNLGNVVTLFNGMEPCAGAPGPLGVTVSGSGNVYGGLCFVKAIGNGAGVIAVPGSANAWYFSVSNSASP